jgi:hypothetical protein
MVLKFISKITKKPIARIVTKKNLIGFTESISVYGAIATIESAAVVGAMNLNWFFTLPDRLFTIISLFKSS